MLEYDKRLISLVNDDNIKKPSIYCNIKSELRPILLDQTSFLDSDIGITQRLLYVKFNKHSHVKCPTCNKKTQFNGNKEIGYCSPKCSMARINPETGISRALEIGRKSAKTRSKLDENGDSIDKRSARKTSQTLNRLDENGDSIAKLRSIKTKNTRSKLDENGKSSYDRGTIKGVKTRSKLDENGISIAEKSARKGVETRSIPNENGISIGMISARKSAQTMQVKDQNGDSRVKKAAQKTSKTLKRLDENGDSIAKRRAIKSAYTMTQLDENGDSIAKNSGIKGSITKKTKFFEEMTYSLSDKFKFVTTKTEYLNAKKELIRYSCNKCNSIRESYWPYIRCTTCYPYSKSIGEHEVLDFCVSLGTVPYSNSRSIIPPLELDIYLPNHNLAIEYNGLYWHSSDSVETEKPNYHLNKTEQCKSKGIQLFHIFENEWQDDKKQKIWKSIISNKLGKSQRIFARKTKVTKVTKITSKETKEFIDSNHIQGTCVSSVNLGLVYDDELVTVMTFRELKAGTWELLRYCNKLGKYVESGARKLLNAFQRENFGSIISYIDKRSSNGDLYEKLGFKLRYDVLPDYYWYKNKHMKLIFQYQETSELLELFDDNLTESENMYENGYRKIYDCGNQVWKLP